jgi:septal ring factor EnvC (AmiA/AmiB activator)
MNQLSWILLISLGAALLAQGLVMRRAQRRQLAAQQAVLLRTQQAMNDRLDKTKQQIGQLQKDLSAARLQLRQLGKSAAASEQDHANSKRALERELDAATASRHDLPIDGFADTQPALPVTQHGSLLLQ